jgi:protein SCO1
MPAFRRAQIDRVPASRRAKVRNVTPRVLITAAIVACLSADSARAQSTPSLYERESSSQPPSNKLPELLTEIGLDQKLNEQLPLDLPFKDEAGHDVRLGQFFGKRPVILTLVYYECPMLCTQVLNGLTSALGVLSFNVGQEFDIVTVSFDPKETSELAAAKKKAYLERYKRPGAGNGWHFLTGDEKSIAALTKAVGFRYAYNSGIDQYAHVSGFMVVTPDGKLSRYFYGIEYGPRDVRLALIEAADQKIGTAVDQLLLYCFHYDPKSARYSLAIMRLVRTAGLATVLALVTGVLVLRRRDQSGRGEK